MGRLFDMTSTTVPTFGFTPELLNNGSSTYLPIARASTISPFA
jgi:hypothetical protein